VIKLKKIRARKIISGAITTLLSIALLFMIFVVISSKASGGEPSFLGYQLKTVMSGSMEPTFKTGSIIAVKPLSDTKNLKEKDVITFMQQDQSIVTHRIIKVIKQGNQVMYQTKGDNNKAPDFNPVQSQNVIAEYSGFTIPYLGYLINYAKSSKGTAILLIVPGVLLLIYSAVSIIGALRELDKTRKETEKTA
jgi:signal peptidase I